MEQIFKDKVKKKKSKYYRPNIISVMVTRGGYLKGSKLYKASRTIE